MNKPNLSGLYLVVDPSIEQQELLSKIDRALRGGVSILQIWNHWADGIDSADKIQLTQAITQIAADYSVPVLINDEWELLQHTDLDGVHFDKIPQSYEQIKTAVSHDFLAGITCSNDLKVVDWAEQNDLNYISFCSMFPSASVSSCEIVRPETVQKARQRTTIPLFLSGGITPKNIPYLKELDFNGVAVISGILSRAKPQQQASHYNQALTQLDLSI